jgi:exodeoxyribonuclease-3
MPTLKILSWNVNGIRATAKKGFFEFLEQESPDLLFIQETKAEKEQLDESLLTPEGYHTFWNSSKTKRGYSGTALFTKHAPKKIEYGIGEDEFDQEGRTMVAHFADLVFFGVYFPNGKMNPERLQFKLDFYEAFQKRVEKEVKEGKKVIICGDVNTAHHPIDLARPKENEKISGFLPEERAWMDRFEEAGFHDAFRIYHPEEPENYTWWSMRAGSRGRNVGWRIDYFYCSENIKDSLKDAFHLPEVMGSDHCPLGIQLEVPKKALKNDSTEDPHSLAGDSHLQKGML